MGKKPRDEGITLCIDTLEPLSYVESLLDDMSSYIDYVRIGWGLNFILDEKRLRERIKVYHNHGIEVCTGGTCFYIVNTLDIVSEFLEFCERVGFDFVEIAEGVDLIEGVKRCEGFDFGIMAEVGEKESGYEFSVEEELDKIKTLLGLNVKFVVIEGRADGASGIYDEKGNLQLDPIETIKSEVPLDRIIIEAPRIKQQIFFINKYGPNINFGNVRLKDAGTLETLRRGFKYDTRELLKKDSTWLKL